MIHPVILCGGSGTRLWPLSRKDFPKQFTRILGDETLFQASLKRFMGPKFAAPVLLAHADFRFLAAEQTAELGISKAKLLLEPQARNTAPAILSAALYLEAQNAAAEVMIVAPSDHVVRDVDAFLEAVTAGAVAASDGKLVTFGIAPDRAETGYGYLELPTNPELGAVQPVRRFVEKPDVVTASEMLAAGNYLWNAGIFMFRADTLIKAFETHAPEMLAPARAALEKAELDLGFLRLDAAAYADMPEDSIDYAIMEKASDVVAVPVSCGWSDLGAWDAVWREMTPDSNGVSVSGDVTEIDCRDTLLRSEEDGPRLVGVNLDGIAVVAMRDAVLVADKSDLQAVKAAVSKMKAEGVREAETLPRTYRPWGWYETLALADRFQVKQIMVPPGKKLSLQSHHHRAEHWIVVKGTATVTIDDEVKLVSENQSVYIPLGAVHRLENPGKVNLHLIEVQTGAYLGEDDIVRYEDIYNRA
ncbi:mannose-1-phosphate guanylyltransferase/mannose-6-phosphate isomerase [Pseudoruegeria sp. SK021]|uniref:mannose-1-phosphate guanylyltransferase/mannose-6-phosphate isomerase n=1 Tax=Pseudoruegeria sp. SK021 TaxID=1933035 RepID=UPI000A2262FB|nr:mannose-1-phosphate guanylyltransferase/mannose-6-phosphate isomerase [Pseudoruegeria sp. SK021]OSP54068.1 mannose-1-phosphate guanylyltransferase/mannose-6-phosphate isomerase [Pseudoruegeria sp. SK021]